MLVPVIGSGECIFSTSCVTVHHLCSYFMLIFTSSPLASYILEGNFNKDDLIKDDDY